MSNSPLLPTSSTPTPNPPPTEPEYLDDPTTDKSAIMGMTLSTAKFMVPLAWAYDFLAQQWAILIANPNMQVINDRNPGAFSPIPYAIGAWFFPQQIIEVMYIREFFRPAGQIEKIVLDFAPFFVLGNFMIGTWPIPWNAERLQLADAFVIVNTIQSLYWVYFRRAKNPVTYQQKLTNAVAYSFAGIGILDFLHNTSIGFFTRQPPSTLVKAAALIGFPVASYFSPVAMGMSFVYNQIAVAIGQADLANKAIGGFGGGGGADWAKMMGISAVVTAGIVGLKYRKEGKIL